MIIELPVLETITDLQAQHGLNYENYRRYRSYCSRRLHRLRHSLNTHQGIASTARARHQRGRKLADVTNAMVLEAGSKSDEYGERMLTIPLFLAERAWSYAMQLKQDMAEQPRRKYHLLRRIKKASEHAERFKKLCHDPESPCSERTKLESSAYAAYISGINSVEHEVWSDAKDKLREAFSLYFRLCLLIDKEEVMERYRRRVDELRSSLRYCAFNLNEMTSKKNFNTPLPAILQFHDIAFKHVEHYEVGLPDAQKEKTDDNFKNASEDDNDDDDDDDEFYEASSI